MLVARHAGQTSKMKPEGPRLAMIGFVVFVSEGLRINAYCQARRPNLENEGWKGLRLAQICFSILIKKV